MIKTCLTFTTVFSLVSAQALAVPLTSEDKIKNCMAAIFASQSEFHQKKHAYTKKISDLSLSQYPDCEGIKSKIKEASVDSFTAEVTDGTSKWKIDSSKTMMKLN
jgi:hypothetical protein